MGDVCSLFHFHAQSSCEKHYTTTKHHFGGQGSCNNGSIDNWLTCQYQVAIRTHSSQAQKSQINHIVFFI